MQQLYKVESEGVERRAKATENENTAKLSSNKQSLLRVVVGVVVVLDVFASSQTDPKSRSHSHSDSPPIRNRNRNQNRIHIPLNLHGSCFVVFLRSCLCFFSASMFAALVALVFVVAAAAHI